MALRTNERMSRSGGLRTRAIKLEALETEINMVLVTERRFLRKKEKGKERGRGTKKSERVGFPNPFDETTFFLVEFDACYTFGGSVGSSVFHSWSALSSLLCLVGSSFLS